MKKILLACLIMMSAAVSSFAQFSTADTVKAYVGTAPFYYAYINNTSGGSLTVKWQIIGSDFPSDWLADLNICDNHICYTNSGGGLWNGTSGNLYTSDPYPAGPGGDFHMVNNFTSVTPGTHWLTVNIKDNASSFNKNTTFIISRPTTGVTTVVKSDDDVVLYPNPAVNDLNVIFNDNAGVKNIAIYNVIGKAVNVYKTIGTSARLDVSALPTGVYFIRLINAQGNIVATRKFNKQ